MQDDCKICGNHSLNKNILVKEMMIGSGDAFNYLHCYNCQCLQLIDVPDNMAQYYPENYYSFERTFPYSDGSEYKKYIRCASMRCHLGVANLWDKMVGSWKKIYFSWLTSGLVTLDSKILDVGCGNGFLIAEMSQYGFTNLHGIDAFVDDQLLNNGISEKVIRSKLETYDEGDFELIMFHHSFEHVDRPLQILLAARDRLIKGGTIIIRTPIANSFAFRKYRQFWVQLDAPRHYFIHTISSMQHMCEQAGLKIQKILFDSNSFQFTGSECYLRGLPLNQSMNLFTNSEVKKFQSEAERLNAIQDGDSACFYLSAI